MMERRIYNTRKKNDITIRDYQRTLGDLEVNVADLKLKVEKPTIQ